MVETVVDCHSHVFNAEDLPIDGFIKKLSPAPDILTGILSVPLDRLTQWVASSSGHEAAYLASLLAPRDGLEGATTAPPPSSGSDLVSDAELDELFVLEWERRGLLDPADTGPGGLEAGTDPVALLAAGVMRPEGDVHRAELDAWLETLSDPDLEAELALEALEGPRDWYARIQATRRAVGRYVDALRLVTRDRHLVAAALAAAYRRTSLFVPALVDFELTTRDAPSSPVTAQVRVHSLLAKVSVVGKIPDAPEVRFHPLVGFCPHREVRDSELRDWVPSTGVENRYVPFADPATATPDDRYRPDIAYDPARARALNVPAGPWETSHLSLDGVTRSLDVVRHAVELGGFAGVKIYPPAGYLPLGNGLRFGGDVGERLDTALRALYAYCVRMDVPILAHANHSNGFEKEYDELAGPDGWKLVLDDYPELRVCFGHFGHLHGVGADAGAPAADSWVVRFTELIDSHPHVYADVGNSKLPVSDDYRRNYLETLNHLLGGETPTPVQVRRRSRLMFGTDYWMNTIEAPYADYFDVFEQSYSGAFGEQAGAQFFGGNALRWLGMVGEDGEPDRTNANRERIAAFYQGYPRPDWLPA